MLCKKNFKYTLNTITVCSATRVWVCECCDTNNRTLSMFAAGCGPKRTQTCRGTQGLSMTTTNDAAVWPQQVLQSKVHLCVTYIRAFMRAHLINISFPSFQDGRSVCYTLAESVCVGVLGLCYILRRHSVLRAIHRRRNDDDVELLIHWFQWLLMAIINARDYLFGLWIATHRSRVCTTRLCWCWFVRSIKWICLRIAISK